MFGSKNDFFKQEIKILEKGRIDLEELLSIKGRSKEDIQEYVFAYDYFVANPEDFDGATIVKDLLDVKTKEGYLDCDAMLHDFDYISGANKSFRKKYYADIKYIKNMEKNGKGIRVARFVFLSVLGVPFVIYKKLSKG